MAKKIRQEQIEGLLEALAGIGAGSVSYIGAGSIIGGGTHNVNQATNSSFSFDLSTQTKADIALGVTAHGWGNHSGLYAIVGRTITAGNGLTGGGDLSANRSFVLGTPSAITLSSTNSVGSTTHSHAFTPGGTGSQYIDGTGALKPFPTIPTVNNGTLTMTTGTGLSGGVTFEANQASNATFSVSIASGYTLPTNAQVNTWNSALQAVNLSLGTRTATTMPINNSGGTNVVLPIVTTSLAGLMGAGEKLQLDTVVSWGRGLRVDGNGAYSGAGTWAGNIDLIRNASMYASSSASGKPFGITSDMTIVNFTSGGSVIGGIPRYSGFDLGASVVDDRLMFRMENLASDKKDWYEIVHSGNISSMIGGNFVPYTGATANVNLGTRSITSTGGFIGNATTATTLATARTINGTSFNGSANIVTSYWGTARNITIGNTTKSVNGSGNYSWSLAEIGVQNLTEGNHISIGSNQISVRYNVDAWIYDKNSNQRAYYGSTGGNNDTIFRLGADDGHFTFRRVTGSSSSAQRIGSLSVSGWYLGVGGYSVGNQVEPALSRLVTGSGGWARSMISVSHSGTELDVIGYYGGVGTLTYGYIGGTTYNAKNAIRWSSAGNVGIGLTGGTTPTYQLEVFNSAYVSTYLQRNSTSASNGSAIGFGNNSSYFGDVGFGVNANDFTVRGASGTTLMRIVQSTGTPYFPTANTSTGNMGIAMFDSAMGLYKSDKTINDLISGSTQDISTPTNSVFANLGGALSITNGSTININSVGRVNLPDFNDLNSLGAGFYPFFNTTGSIGYHSSAGQGIVSVRALTSQGGFALWANNSDDGVLRMNVGSSTGWNGWEILATREWANNIFALASSLGNYVSDTVFQQSNQYGTRTVTVKNGISTNSSFLGNAVIDTRSTANPLGSDGTPQYLPNPKSIPASTMFSLFHYGWGGTTWGSSIIVKGWNNGYKAWMISGDANAGNGESDFYFRNSNGTSNTWNPSRMVWTDKHFTLANVNSWNTMASGSFLPTAGGTMNTNSVINWAGGIGALALSGSNVLRFASNATVLSAQGNLIYFRPNGDTSTTNQIIFDNNGQINTPNDGNSGQWWLSNRLRSGQYGTFTDIDSTLPNGGMISGYGTSAWAGSDRPNGASYGGVVRFQGSQGTNSNNALDIYYNNGHGGAETRFWLRTKRDGNISTDWKEIITTENIGSIGNVWTTNTTQVGLSGNKETTGSHIFNGSQATSLFIQRSGSTSNSGMAFGFNGANNVFVGASNSNEFSVTNDANLSTNQWLYANATGIGTRMLAGSYISGRDEGGFTIDKTSTAANWSSIIRHNFSGVGRTAIIGGINSTSAMSYWGMAMWDNAETVNGFPPVFFGFVGNNGTLRATSLAGSGNRFIYATPAGNLESSTFDPSDYVPTTRTLTINGQTFDLSANRSWTIATSTPNDGTLSLATGTGLSGSASFSANQAGNSTFTVGIASGYVLPTTAQVNSWNAKGNGTVTSVGMTIGGNALNTNTATITTSGIFGLTWGGTTAQYVRGDGSLATMPTGTAYTAGAGLTLAGTVFSLPVTVSGTGTFVQSVAQNANGITVTMGTPPNTTYNTMSLVELQAGTVTAGRVISANVLGNWMNGVLAGYVPIARTITINGVTQNLSANRSWNISAPPAPATQRSYDITDSGNNDYYEHPPITKSYHDFGFDVVAYNPNSDEFIGIFDDFGQPYLNEGIFGMIALLDPNTGKAVTKGSVECQGSTSSYLGSGTAYLYISYYRDTNSPTFLSGSLNVGNMQSMVSQIGGGSVEMFNGVIVLGIMTPHNTLMVDIREF